MQLLRATRFAPLRSSQHCFKGLNKEIPYILGYAVSAREEEKRLDVALEVDKLALKADRRFQELSAEEIDEMPSGDVLEKDALTFIRDCGGTNDPKEIK